MAVTLDIAEGAPESYPVVVMHAREGGSISADFEVDAAVTWQRIEAWIRFRFSTREVVFMGALMLGKQPRRDRRHRAVLSLRAMVLTASLARLATIMHRLQSCWRGGAYCRNISGAWPRLI